MEPKYYAFRFGDCTPRALILRRSVIGSLGLEHGRKKQHIP